LIKSKYLDEARDERQRLRNIAEQTIQQSNELINRLRQQIGTASNADVESDILEQRQLIDTTEDELNNLFERKYEIEAEARVLEAEVGPVKYIAELIYGDNADKNALEEAVRWVIMVLVVVFDPLAVVLVISGITLIENNPKRKKKKTEPLVKQGTDWAHVELEEDTVESVLDEVEDEQI